METVRVDSDDGPTNRTRMILISIASFIVLVLPYGYSIDLGPGPNGLMAILWERPEFVSGPQLLILTALEYFIYYLYRFIVLRALWKFLHEMMESKRLLRHGVICEIIPILISIPGALYLNEEGENFIPIMIPLPFLLIYCILVVLYSHNQKRPSTLK